MYYNDGLIKFFKKKLLPTTANGSFVTDQLTDQLTDWLTD